ncbi:MAG TPA: hypothetical protein DCF33_20570 [Saprospirales bacterium]|nr:hypothetical protein [Saprospirales bacterium]
MKKYVFTLCITIMASILLHGQQYWSKRYDIELGNEYGSQIIVREDGFLVSMRGFCGVNNAEFCYGIIKFDLDGEKQWQSLIYDSIGPNGYIALAIRNDTILFNVDYTTSDSCGVLAYDMQGNYVGRYNYWHPGVPGTVVSRDLKSKGERLFVNFSYKDTLENRVKDKIRAYDPAWNQLWEVKLPDNAEYPKIRYADMDACPDGGIITACVSNKTFAETVCSIQKYDANGQQEWTTVLEGMYEIWSVPATIHAHPDGGYTGHWQLSTGDVWSYPYPDMWFKLDANGQIQWQKINDPYTKKRNFINTFVAKNGDLIGCGNGDESPYDTIPDLPYQFYAYIARIKPDGELRWERRIYEKKDGGYSPVLYHGAEMENGDLIFTGYVWDTIQTPQNPSWDDLWLLKLDSNGCLTPNCDYNQYVLPAYEPSRANQLDAFTVFPNPAVDQFTLAGILGKHIPSGNYKIVIYDALGRELLQQEFDPNLLTTIRSADWPTGAYSLVILRNGMEGQVIRLAKQ